MKIGRITGELESTKKSREVAFRKKKRNIGAEKTREETKNKAAKKDKIVQPGNCSVMKSKSATESYEAEEPGGKGFTKRRMTGGRARVGQRARVETEEV